jgi:hypothetical protein
MLNDRDRPRARPAGAHVADSLSSTYRLPSAGAPGVGAGGGGTSFGRTVVAALVFLVAAWLLLGVIIHVLSFLFSTLILVVAVVAVVWALRVLL